MTRKTAPEIIGTYLGWSIEDVRETAYQSSRYTAPYVYAISTSAGDYLCCPSGSQKPPRDIGTGIWTEIGELHGRKIYATKSSSLSLPPAELNRQRKELRQHGILVDEEHFGDGWTVRMRLSDKRETFPTLEEAIARGQALLKGEAA